MDPAYWMAMVLIALKVCFKAASGSLNLVSRSFIEGVCVVPLAPAVSYCNYLALNFVGEMMEVY